MEDRDALSGSACGWTRSTGPGWRRCAGRPSWAPTRSTTSPIGIASVDFLKQESVLDLLERTSYDAVVIDEAHHCMDLGALGEREDTQRRRLAELLARQCDALLLLTATPHDGQDRSFASLCELLDASLVDGRGRTCAGIATAGT